MFTTVIDTFYGLVASDNTLADVTVVPSDYKGSLPPPPFIKLSVVFAKSSLESYEGTKRVTGLLKLALFSTSGKGPRPLTVIAAELDDLLEKKLLTNDIQTYASSIQFLGTDLKDSTLSVADYTVPFSYYGE